MSCSVDIGRALYAAAHPGVGGAGTSACSGDLRWALPCSLRTAHMPDGRDEHGARRRVGGRDRRGRSRPPGHARAPGVRSASRPSASGSISPATGSEDAWLVSFPLLAGPLRHQRHPAWRDRR
jgi:hypothetical protein